jgi:hypothetical protein
MARGLHTRSRTVCAHPKGLPWRASPPTRAPSRRPCRRRPAPTRPRQPGRRARSPTCSTQRPLRRRPRQRAAPPRARMTDRTPRGAAPLPAMQPTGPTPQAPQRPPLVMPRMPAPRAVTTRAHPARVAHPPAMRRPIRPPWSACRCRPWLCCRTRIKQRQLHKTDNARQRIPRNRGAATGLHNRTGARMQARPMPFPRDLLLRSRTFRLPCQPLFRPRRSHRRFLSEARRR